MASSNTRSNIDWFDVGWKAFKKSRQGAVSFPPLGDREAQRAWLGGFGAAWASDLDAHTSVDGAL
jgi:hypothetical protein